MNFVVNEVRYVEDLLEKKQLTPRKVTKELRMIAKYYLSQHDKQTLNRNVSRIYESSI